jgi:hypothetical protein
MTDRRQEARFVPPTDRDIRATLRPGCEVTLADVCGRGACVLAPKPLRPGSRVHLQVVVASRRLAVAGQVLRCMVWCLEPGSSVVYRAAVRFDDSVEWQWGEPIRRAQRLSERAGR